MGVVFTNNAETTLAAAISSTSATSISVSSSSSFPSLAAGEYFYATVDDGTNHEIVKVTGISGTTWTVVRAADNTTARTIANGSTVQLRATSALLTDIQENIAAKSANQTVFSATAASNATAYNVGVDPGVEANASIFLDGVYQNHDTFSFDASTVTFDAAPTNGTKIEIVVDNLINLQSSNLTTDTFTATSGQTAFTLSDAPAAENNLLVFIEGAFQDQGNYSISNHTLTLATGAVEGRTVTVYIINPVNIGTPSDNTVTSAKLSGNITTPGTLTVGSHNVSFDSPTFVVDHSNSRVGLGTSTPSVPVDIVGEVKISSHLNLPDNAIAKFGTGGDLQIFHSSNANFIKTNSDLPLKFFDAGGASMIEVIPNGAVALYHNGSAKLATASGGVTVTGVVTATSLDISGDIDVDGTTNLDIVDIDGAVDMASTLQVDGNVTLGANLTIPEYIYHAGDANSFFGFSAADTWKVNTGGTQRLIIDNAGFLDYAAAGNDIARFSGANSGGLTIRNDTANQLILHTGTSDALVFGTGGNNDRMTITSAGNVGIGTTSPNAYSGQTALTINSSGVARLDLDIGNTIQGYLLAENGYIGLFSSSGKTLRLGAGAEAIRILANGRVGIGTIAPSANLDIAGGGSSTVPTLELTSATSTAFNHSINAFNPNLTDGEGNLIVVGRAGSTKNAGWLGYRYSSAGSDNNIISLGHWGNNYLLNVKGNGNVGIGTTAPATLLHVKAASGEAELRLEAAANSEARLRFGDATDNDAGYIGYSRANGILNFSALNSAGAHMQINASGRVGMNTAGGNAGLTVSTDIRAIGASFANDANSITMSQESGFGAITARGPSTAERGVLKLSVNRSNGAAGIAGIVIGSAGTVGINIAPTTGVQLYVDAPVNRHAGLFRNASANYAPIISDNLATSGTRFFASFRLNNTEVGKITSTGSSTVYATSSDHRLKENVDYTWDATTRLKQLKPARFNWIADATNTLVDGFIAHEAATVVPESVTGEKDAVDVDSNPVMQGIDQSKLVPLLVKTIQELEARITILEG